MKSERNDVSQSRLHYLFDYEVDSGRFIRKIKTAGRVRVGDNAGTRHNKGYWLIMVDGVLYLRHRLAWLYVTGEWPEHEVDHVDMDRANDAWSNLRAATASENQSNRRIRPDNKIGLKGVSRASRTTFWSSVSHQGKTTYLGTTTCPAAAHLRYVVEADKLFGEYSRVR